MRGPGDSAAVLACMLGAATFSHAEARCRKMLYATCTADPLLHGKYIVRSGNLPQSCDTCYTWW
jgi:hypothetical protein